MLLRVLFGAAFKFFLLFGDAIRFLGRFFWGGGCFWFLGHCLAFGGAFFGGGHFWLFCDFLLQVWSVMLQEGLGVTKLHPTTNLFD